MASTNQSPFYKKAEEKFLAAQTDEQRLIFLEEMIKECPKHKSSEKMLAQLRTRHKKLQEKIERVKKSGKSSKKGIKKEDMQAVIIGKTNSGKSSLISVLTNAKPKISQNKNMNFTTKSPEIGMMEYSLGVGIQIIEIPAIESDYYDKSIVNTADLILILVSNIKDIDEIKKYLEKTRGKIIIVFNKIDFLDEKEKRKIFSTLKTKKHNFVLISTKTLEGLDELRDKIFMGLNKIRIYTKDHSKGIKKSEKPVILDKGDKVKDVAEKVFGNSAEVKEAFITGPSSKFPNQKTSLNHELKDLDIVEFKVK